MMIFQGSLLLLGLGITMVLMWLFWLLEEKTKNAGLADIGWVLGIVVLVTLDAWTGIGWGPRKLAAFLLSSLWGMRLGFYLLFNRVVAKPEDGRYQQLRREWKKDPDQKFLFLFEFRAFLSMVFSLPFLLACFNPLQEWTPLEKISLILWAVAFLGESLSDWQLYDFKREEGRKKTCREGLWRFSRHPNYFFEFLLWCANALFACSAPLGPVAVLCPVLILFLFFKVTGIPVTEAQALRTKGKDYRKYQRSTSVFLPWLPKAQRG